MPVKCNFSNEWEYTTGSCYDTNILVYYFLGADLVLLVLKSSEHVVVASSYQQVPNKGNWKVLINESEEYYWQFQDSFHFSFYYYVLNCMDQWVDFKYKRKMEDWD